jgi:hypothetical protein
MGDTVKCLGCGAIVVKLRKRLVFTCAMRWYEFEVIHLG